MKWSVISDAARLDHNPYWGNRLGSPGTPNQRKFSEALMHCKILSFPKTRSALSPAHLQASGPSIVSETKGRISPR